MKPVAHSGVNARVALVMATRDQSHLLQSVRSLLAQTHQNFTLTIVDEGVERPAKEVLKSVQDPRITIIEQPHQGFIAALNIAIKKSKPAAFYGVAYASCFYAPHFLDTLLKRLMRTPQSVGAFCHFHEGHSNVIYQEPLYSSHELLVRDFIGPGVLFRANAFKTAGNLFLSARRGILETWQRMQQKVGPWSQVNSIAVRWYPDAYDSPPKRPRIDFEKNIYPHLKPVFLVPEEQSIDSELLVILSQTGHTLVPESTAKKRVDFILCGDLKQLEHSLKLAQIHYAPLLLVLNDQADVEFLEKREHQYLLASCHVLTRRVAVAQAVKNLSHQPTVYMPEMTPREVKRFLSRFPFFLYRHRCVFFVRSVGGPTLLKNTINAIKQLHRPPEAIEMFVFNLDSNAETTAWLNQSKITNFSPQKFACFPEILFLMRQLQGSFVCSIDSGLIPSNRWLTSLLPLLAHPMVGMVSGHLNDVMGYQELPFEITDLQSLQDKWSGYKPRQRVLPIRRLHDSMFLTRKSTFEYVLERFPETRPLADDYTWTRLLNLLGFKYLLSRETVAFNQRMYL